MALKFRSADAAKLYDLAFRHYPENSEDGSWFAQAARAAERGSYAVLECGAREQIEEAVAFFIRWGVEPLQVEELRFG